MRIFLCSKFRARERFSDSGRVIVLPTGENLTGYRLASILPYICSVHTDVRIQFLRLTCLPISSLVHSGRNRNRTCKPFSQLFSRQCPRPFGLFPYTMVLSDGIEPPFKGSKTFVLPLYELRIWSVM